MMKDLQEAIGYTFRDPALLTEAMTHSSYAHEQHKNMKYNERLEFLGDAVLSIVVSDYIYKHCPNLPEGELTKLRASLVCEKSLFDFAKQIDRGADRRDLPRRRYGTRQKAHPAFCYSRDRTA